MRLLVTVAILSIGLMLAACGDDDGDNGEVADTVQETTATDEANTTDQGLVATGKVVELTADPDGDLAYQQENATAQSGEIQIEFTNESQVPHNVVVETEEGETLGRTDVITDAEAQASINLTPGTYTFYCSVDAHRQAGMEGTLVVIE